MKILLFLKKIQTQPIIKLNILPSKIKELKIDFNESYDYLILFEYELESAY